MNTESEVSYYVADSAPAAQRRLATTDGVAKVVAGGQTLSLLLRQGLIDADALIDVSAVPSLSGVTVDGDRGELGAATTYATLAGSALADRVGVLGDSCAVVGDRQVRTLGTVGGAVCHADPALDIVPALLCLDATLTVGSVEGRRPVPLDSFLVGHVRTDLGEAELLERITVDVPDGRTGTAYEKHAPVETTWATVGTASRVTVEAWTITDASVALASVADTAVRAPAVERALVGESVSQSGLEDASRAVVEDIDPIDDEGGSAAYKREVAPTVVQRSLATAVRRAGGSL